MCTEVCLLVEGLLEWGMAEGCLSLWELEGGGRAREVGEGLGECRKGGCAAAWRD